MSNKTIKEIMDEAIKDVNEEQKEEIGHIIFAKLCIERFLEKLGEKNG